MSDRPPQAQNVLRRVALALLPIFLILITVSVLAAQFTELKTRNEILSLSSFIVIISFSGLAFNWCRVSSTFASEESLKAVFHIGIDLFVASLLALVASFFAWLQATPASFPASLYPVLFTLHFVFLLLSLLFFLVSILTLLKITKDLHKK